MTATTPPIHWSTLPNAPAPGTALRCNRHALPDGQATLWELDTGGSGPDRAFKLILLRCGAQVTAFVNRCAHFGVPLAAKQSQLIFTPLTSITCNVHYARYRWADGTCDGGECEGEGLVPVPLHIADDGALSIANPGG
jgi:nitrite reductase/ring-hydroxylating ferredoxin subunit